MKKSLFLTLMLSLAFSHPLMAEEVTVGTGTYRSSFPFYTSYKYSTTETIYPASELGGSGTITSISFDCCQAGALDSEVKIYMGHKAESSFSSTSDYMPTSALTLVYDHSVSLGNSTGWVKFELDKQFEYKADQSLAVVVCKSSTNTISQYNNSTTGDFTKRTLCRYSNNSSLYAEVEETEGFSCYDNFPNAKFEFLSETMEKNGATYQLRTNSDCAILAEGQSCSGNLIIPNVITDAKGASYKVTTIKAEAFKNNTKITSVSIPEHVASIANFTFYGCTGLTSISIPNSVTGIGSEAFYGCSGLTSIIIPNLVTSIGSSAFYGCSKLSKVCNLSNLSIGSNSSNGYVGYYANAIYQGTSAGSVGDFHFITDSEGKTTLWNYTGSTTEIALPEKYEGASYEIGGRVFYNHSELTSVTIPNSVTSIGAYAFRYCSGLTSIIIPNSVTGIGTDAFRDCSGLTSIIIPNSVTGIGDYAFYGCSGLTSIIIPNSVTSIGSSAFWGCSKLSKVCNLSNLSIGSNSSNGYVGYYANVVFKGTNAGSVGDFHFVTDSEGKTTLWNYTGSATEITLPEKYDGTSYEIGERVFYNHSELTSVTIPNSVTSIGNYAFYNCSGLTSIIIPNSVTSIGDGAFSGCSNLSKVCNLSNLSISTGSYSNNGYVGYYANAIYQGTNAGSVGDFHFVTDSEGKTTLWNYTGSATEITLPEKYEGASYEIGAYAFYNRSELTSVTIPNSVTSIGNYAFQGCSNLKTVTIPKSVTKIGDYAFSGCPLRSVTFGAGLLSIGNKAFSGVTKAIWLANTPPSGYANAGGTINYVANDQYTSLKNKMKYPLLSSLFTVNGVSYVPTSMTGRTCDAVDCLYDDSAELLEIGASVTYKNVTFAVENINDYICYDNDSIKSLVVREGTSSIGAYAFYDCNGMASATLLEGLGSLGQYAFTSCTNLESIALPDSLTTLGKNAFQDCSSMKTATIGKSLKTLPEYVFSGCSSLMALTVPQNVTSISSYALQDCSALKTLIIDNREQSLKLSSNGSQPLFVSCPLDSVFIGGKITYNTSSSYGYSPFYRNTSLRSVVVADNEDEIYANEFYGCVALKNVTIGDGVKKIGNWAFSGCSSLDHFIYGSSLATIGDEAFSDCTAITEITTRRAVPPVCGSQALEDINKWECTLRIPVENVEAYASADQWKEFLFAEGLSGDVHTLSFVIDGNLYQLDYHTHGSVIIPPTVPEKAGYTFAGWNDLPDYMPDGDLEIKSSYKVNQYKLTYYLDGEVYSEKDINYGTRLTALASPTKEGWYYFSGWNDVPEKMPAHNVSIYGTLNPYVLGDVNNDGEITVTDAVGIGNLILNTNTQGLIRAAADVNNDKTVSVADMIYECNVILGNSTITPARKAMSRVETSGDATLALSDVALAKEAENMLYVSLNNPFDEITGLQFDLYLPEGIRVATKQDEFDGSLYSDITLTDRINTRSHNVTSAVQQDGAVRVLISSETLSCIRGEEGCLLGIRLAADENLLQGEYILGMDNIELGRPDNVSLRQAACRANVSVNQATSIQQLAIEGADAAYDLNGRKAEGLNRGVIIRNGQKQIHQ